MKNTLLGVIGRKVVAAIGLVAMTFALLPVTATAAVLEENLVTAINYKVGEVAKDTFKPSSGEQLSMTISYNTLGFAEQMASATGTIKIKKGADVVKTFPNIAGINVADNTLTWDGKVSDNSFCSNPPGSACMDGTYTLEVDVQITFNGDTLHEKETKDFTITSDPVLAINAFTIVPTKGGATFDPAPSSNDEDVAISYTLSQAADVRIDIKDSKDKVVKNFNDTAMNTHTVSWDGVFENKLVVPGIYKVVLTATKAGMTTATQTKDLVVAYNNGSKPAIDAYSLSPQSFDPDFEDSTIKFTNLKDANISVEIRQADGTVVRTFGTHDGDSFNAGDTHSVVWDGKNNSGSIVADGGYILSIVLRNDFGVTTKEDTFTLINSDGSITSSNNHIDNISFSPSARFKPDEDEELKVEFDAKIKLDELTITAVRGQDKYEFYRESNVDKETNIETTWDGKGDDDEYVEAGTWRIEFRSKFEATNLIATKSITVEYEKPNIDEFLISKTKFDNDLGEKTYALFKIDRNAQITLSVLLGGDEDDTLEEEMDVEKDRWYAVEFDGSSYDYSDDIDLKLTASNVSNVDVYDSEKLAVDLAEDDTSSSVSNVTMDYVDPVITDGQSDMTVYYELEEDADVVVTIYKGKNTTGSKVIELLNEDNQEAGEHSIPWNGRDDDGSVLSKGFYTYKIVSQKSGTDTEMGTFVVGDSEDVQTIGDTGNSGSGSGSGSSSATKCANFTDVSSSSDLCESITWAKNSGVVRGYSDGTFRPSAPINRVELLKVVLEALGIGLDSSVSGTLGFSDVEVGAWYMGYIKAGKDRGIFNGDSGKSTARPGDTVNRAEALKMAFETLRVQDGFVINSCSSSFVDVKTTDWFARYACQAKTYDLFENATVNLEPGTFSSRGEVVEMLYRMHKAGLL